jgi:alcohol dehydrogenase YqhD (iron-dependent ADH family)
MGSRFIADFATHKIEHELSALFDVAHGAGLSAIWSSWARFVMHCDYHRFAQFATNVMGVERCSDDESTAERGIAEIERLYRSWGMPVGLKELLSKPASEEQIKLMASKCTKGGTFRPGNFCSLSEEHVVKILTMANEL